MLPGRVTLYPSPDEVDAVFDVSLAQLLADGVFREEWWDLPAGDRPVPFFELDHDTVWGATARILYQLLELVTR